MVFGIFALTIRFSSNCMILLAETESKLPEEVISKLKQLS